ncbi:MAG: transposase [Anaerolineales bacterium]|nr:transposase [Anaerolineales bacterium]
MQPAVLAVENSFDLAPARLMDENSFDLAAKRRSQIIWRIDAGFGTDDKLHWLIGRDYQVLAKGHSGRRAKSLAKQVKRWSAYGDAWQGSVPAPVDFGREVKVVVKKRLKKDKFLHSFYLTTLKLPSNSQLLSLYDQRGAMEVEPFRNDKQGLHLSSRRKHGFLAQKALILLTDMAHNLLADFYHSALAGSSFQGYGPKRIVRDLLAMEGRIHLDTEQLMKVELSANHRYAEELLDCLVRYEKSYQ